MFDLMESIRQCPVVPDRIRIDFSRLDPDLEEEKLSINIQRSDAISFFEVLDVLF
jgi:hypothetical protein